MGLGADVTLEELERDPDPILAEMRSVEPVCWVPALDMWFVTRWDDVEALDADPERFTAATDPSFLARALGPNMLTMDPPSCTRTQNAMRPSFQPRGVAGPFVAERLEAMADAFLDRVLGGMPAASETGFDVMEAYAAPLAAGALADVLGLGHHGADTMWEWCAGICTDIANFENDPDKTEIGARAKAELAVAIDERLAQLRARPEACALNDFITAHPDDGPLTHDEIVNNVRLMISGGINEPRDGIGLVVWTLLDRPDLRERVEGEPAKWPKLVEEVLRRYSPVGTITRQATATTEFVTSDDRSVRIEEGQLIAGVLRSANLDEGRFDRPLEIDLDRTERGHAAFATGPHRCLGEWLGRQEVRIGARRLLERLPSAELVGPVELTGFEFRGPAALHIRSQQIDGDHGLPR